MREILKILIVDDMIAYHRILTDICASINGVEVTGAVSNGRTALSHIQISPPDLILFDVSMPDEDGLETFYMIRGLYPDIDVIVVSGIDRGNANLTMKALEFGALDFVAKPQTVLSDESLKVLQMSLVPLISLAKGRMLFRFTNKLLIHNDNSDGPSRMLSVEFPVQPFQEPSAGMKREMKKRRFSRRIEAIGIGVSTGGPNALQKIIPFIEADLRVPIFAVQHMPPAFTTSLAERLDRDSNISVVEAKNGDIVETKRMYIAPGGTHMVVRKNYSGDHVIGIMDSPPVNSCKPSIDVLFGSLSQVYGGNILTVILTGMGRDGASGVSAIKEKGGYSIVQDEATSVVWGMPQAVVESNDADEVLPVDKIAQRIMEIAGRG